MMQMQQHNAPPWALAPLPRKAAHFQVRIPVQLAAPTLVTKQSLLRVMSQVLALDLLPQALQPML